MKPYALKTSDAAKYIGSSPTQLARYVAEGRLACSQPNPPSGNKFFLVADLERFINEHMPEEARPAEPVTEAAQPTQVNGRQRVKKLLPLVLEKA